MQESSDTEKDSDSEWASRESSYSSPSRRRAAAKLRCRKHLPLGTGPSARFSCATAGSQPLQPRPVPNHNGDSGVQEASLEVMACTAAVAPAAELAAVDKKAVLESQQLAALEGLLPQSGVEEHCFDLASRQLLLSECLEKEREEKASCTLPHSSLLHTFEPHFVLK